jgi:hypothetical protein
MTGAQVLVMVVLSMLAGIGALFLSIGFGLLKISVGG